MAETTAIVCGHVFKNERPVKAVIHHSDGVWQLVCGEKDHSADCADFEPVGLEHLFERQSELLTLANLRPGYLAEKTSNGWSITPYKEAV